jgi:hypothetical protein
MSVSRAKSEITATEFLRWCAYLERDVNDFHREDHYRAEIAYQLYRLQHILGGTPRLRREDFLLRFEPAGKKPAPAEPTPGESRTAAARGKGRVLASLGLRLSPDGKTAVPLHRGRPSARPAVRPVSDGPKKVYLLPPRRDD